MDTKFLATLLMLLTVALAGCSDSGGDTAADEPGTDTGDDAEDGSGAATEDAADDGSDSGDSGSDSGSGGDEGSGDESDPDGAATTLEITAFSVNVTGSAPVDAVFSFDGTGDSPAWSLDADGDGTADAEGDALPANATFTYDAAGAYNATLTLTDASGSVDSTLEVAVSAPAATGPAPEGGHIEGASSGAFAQADIGRTEFKISNAWPTLEVTTYLEDPAATEGGSTYTVRFTPPSGGNDDYTVAYGETITIPNPEVGTWEIGIFPAGAGAWDWTADWCAYDVESCA